VRRLRELSEAECYARCYGGGDEGVRVLWEGPGERAVRRLEPEDVRLLFAGHESGTTPSAGFVPVAAAAAAA
jgi:hypothetical protein